jgi:phage-related protein
VIFTLPGSICALSQWVSALLRSIWSVFQSIRGAIRSLFAMFQSIVTMLCSIVRRIEQAAGLRERISSASRETFATWRSISPVSRWLIAAERSV